MEPWLTDTPFGLSVLGGLSASLFAVLGLGIGLGLRPLALRRHAA